MQGRYNIKQFLIHFSSRLAILFICGILISGCASFLPSSGPSRKEAVDIQKAPPDLPIQIIDVTSAIARKILSVRKQTLFSETLGSNAHSGYLIGAGDTIEVSVWEAPPATLFSTSVIDPRLGPATTRATVFPEQMVNSDGNINIPFAGIVPAAGRTPQQVEKEIERRLTGKANQPQVLVRLVRNATSIVTIVGEVVSSTRMPLTAKGERLLDAIAATGGVRQPVGKIMIQITRGKQVQALPLDFIIQDPNQNIVLLPGDVITALYQPLSFTVLGATGKNEEVYFEAQGISLSQALARAGGLQDARADAKGVFIFRFEDSSIFDTSLQGLQMTPEGKVPVIYRVDLKDPATFFVAQSFPISNKDVMYVSNAPAVELQRFLNIVTSVVYPMLNISGSLTP